MGKCKYCNDEYYVEFNVGTFEFSDIEIGIHGDSKSIRIRVYENGHINTQEFVVINYCPICGRKLGDE